MRSVWLFIGVLSSILSILSFAKIYQFWPGLDQEIAGLLGILITLISFYFIKKLAVNNATNGESPNGDTPP